jgi:hypothetical protein
MTPHFLLDIARSAALLTVLSLAACKPGPADRRFSTAMVRQSVPAHVEGPLLRFDWAGDFSEGLAPVEVHGSFGFIDTAGNYRVEPRFAFAGAFAGNRAPVQIEGKWGYTDATGRLAIPPVFAWAGSFSEGRAPIADSLGYAYIDTDGALVGDGHYSDVRPFSGGLAGVKFGGDEDGAWGFIDGGGKEAIPPLFIDVAGGFSDGLAAVKVGGEPPYHIGYIDSSGGFAIDTLYDAAGDFSEGLAPVGRGEWRGNGFKGVWGYVDSSGRLALPLRYSQAGPFRNGAALVRLSGGGCRLIGRDGRELGSFPRSTVIPAGEPGSRVTFRLRKRYGFLDAAGRVAIEPLFLEAGPFREGRARVKPASGRGSWSFIDSTGRFLGGFGAITSH